MKPFFYFTLSLFIIQASLFAQEDSVDYADMYSMSLEDLLSVEVQVSSNSRDNIFTTPSTTTIVDRAMIDAYNFQSISELVNCISGVTVSRTYLKRNLPTSRGILQDHYANKVLILINGIPSWNAVTGEGNLDRVNINDVERIEVLKGPASVMYGTNAYTGAINIVLKQADKNTGELYTEVGQYETFRAGGNSTLIKNDIELFISAGTKEQVGFPSQFKGEDEIEHHMNEFVNATSATINLKYKSHHVLGNIYNSEESYLGVAPKFSSGAGNIHRLHGILGSYQFKNKVGNKLNYTLGIDYDFNKRNMSRSQSDDIRANIEGARTNGFVRLQYQLNDNISLEAGANYEQRISKEYKNYNILTDSLSPKKWSAIDTVLDGNNGMKDLSISETSGYGQIQYRKNKFTILLGSRYTMSELFDSDISSRATCVYALSPQNSIKLMYGESFRSPSFFETNFFYSTVLGNKDLKPEKSNSIELSYLTQFKNIFVQALIYHGTYSNKIYRQKQDIVLNDSTVNINIYQNGGTFTANGVELEMRYANPKILSAFIQYGYITGDSGDQIDTIEHYNFKYIPEHTFAAGLHKTLSKFGASILVNYTHETEGFFEPIGSFYTIDGNISYSHSFDNINVRHTLSAKNITDTQQVYPEYTRRKVLNSVASGFGRYIGYSVSILF